MAKIRCVYYGDNRLKLGKMESHNIEAIKEIKGTFFAFDDEGKIVYELRAKEVLIEYEPFEIVKDKKPTKVQEEKEAFRSDVDYLTQKFINLLEFNHSHFKAPASLVSWEKEFDAMLRIDQWSMEDIKLIMDYSQTDNFWKGVILSPKKLRDKKDTLMVQIKNRKSFGMEKLKQIAGDNNGYTRSSQNNPFTFD